MCQQLSRNNQTQVRTHQRQQISNSGWLDTQVPLALWRVAMLKFDNGWWPKVNKITWEHRGTYLQRAHERWTRLQRSDPRVLNSDATKPGPATCGSNESRSQRTTQTYRNRTWKETAVKSSSKKLGTGILKIVESLLHAFIHNVRGKATGRQTSTAQQRTNCNSETLATTPQHYTPTCKCSNSWMTSVTE